MEPIMDAKTGEYVDLGRHPATSHDWENELFIDKAQNCDSFM